MPTADLRNLFDSLAATLARLEMAGFEYSEIHLVGSTEVEIGIANVMVCPTCYRISPAAACLWCTPAEDDPGGKG